MTTAPRVSWENLRPREPAERAIPPDGDTAEEMVMRALAGGPGSVLLAWLRAEYIEKRDPPNAHDVQLRESEARRFLVDRLEKMCKRGLEIAASRSKGAPKA